jgi:hypothetical protein
MVLLLFWSPIKQAKNVKEQLKHEKIMQIQIFEIDKNLTFCSLSWFEAELKLIFPLV